MKTFLKQSGLGYIFAAIGCAAIMLLCLSHGQTALDREVLYARAVDCILLHEYDEAQELLKGLGDYEDSKQLLDYVQARAAYDPADRATAQACLRTLSDLCADYDGVLLPLFKSEAAAIAR